VSDPAVTSKESIEAVARALEHFLDKFAPLIRANALEEAAQLAEGWVVAYGQEVAEGAVIAAAIRALKEQHTNE
jgi:hypothetical protein